MTHLSTFKTYLTNSRHVRNQITLFISCLTTTMAYFSFDDTLTIAYINIFPYLFIHYPRNSINYVDGIVIIYTSNINNHTFAHSETFSSPYLISYPYSRTFSATLFNILYSLNNYHYSYPT